MSPFQLQFKHVKEFVHSIPNLAELTGHVSNTFFICFIPDTPGNEIGPADRKD
jgi:hypothetical protein